MFGQTTGDPADGRFENPAAPYLMKDALYAC